MARRHLVLRPGTPGLQEKSWPIETFFHKVVMLRNRLRTLEQQVNATELPEDLKVKLQGYISGCYGSLTSFNVLFADEDDQFKGAGGARLTRGMARLRANWRMGQHLDAVPFSGIIRIRDMMYSVKDPFRLDQGDVSFDAPDTVKAAMRRAIDENRSHYLQTTGVPRLLDLLADEAAAAERHPGRQPRRGRW